MERGILRPDENLSIYDRRRGHLYRAAGIVAGEILTAVCKVQGPDWWHCCMTQRLPAPLLPKASD